MEGHEAERLGGRGIDCLPHVDTELATEHRQLVHQRDVHVPEGVLDELGQLRFARGGHGHSPGRDPLVEALHRGQRGIVDAGHDLRRGGQRPGLVPRVDALRAVAEVEVRPRDQRGTVLEPRQHLLLRGSRVGGGLHDHRGARAQVAGQGSASRLQAGQVRQAIPQRRGHCDQCDVEAGAGLSVRRRPEPARPECRRQLPGGHVLYVGLPGRQPLDPVQVDVVADYLVPGRHRPHRQRQAHIAQAGHHDRAHRHPPCRRAPRRGAERTPDDPATRRPHVGKRPQPRSIGSHISPRLSDPRRPV